MNMHPGCTLVGGSGRNFRGLLFAALWLGAAGMAAAADYPVKPIRFVAGFAAGGGLDISCRLWAQKLSTALGQPIVVENRPGASSELAVKHVMASPADGYTILCTSASAGISSAKLSPPFDIRTDLAPVIQMTQFTYAFYVSPKMQVKSIAELIAHAKANPGKTNYASVGIGSTPHLAFELFKLATGIDITHIPFKGTSQGSAAIMAGEVQFGLDGASSLKPHFESGRLLPLAVISAQRAPALPDVMSMRDAGIAGVDVISWTGLTAPLKTPRDIVSMLNAQYNTILREPEIKAAFFKLGYETAGGSPEDMARLIAREVDDWSRVIRVAKIQFD